MVGRKSDMEIVRYFYSWLGMECERLSGLEAKGLKLGRVYVASYQEGFVSGIADQLRISRENAKKEATSTAIVLIDSRLEKAKLAQNTLVPGLVYSKGRSYSRRDNGAFDQGKKRGAAIHLGSALSSGSSTKALGN